MTDVPLVTDGEKLIRYLTRAAKVSFSISGVCFVAFCACCCWSERLLPIAAAAAWCFSFALLGAAELASAASVRRMLAQAIVNQPENAN